MCGILGLIGEIPDEKRAAFSSALDLLSHRGPDDAGMHAADRVLLGHRRLSIIDLSNAGHQPMIDDSSGCVISYNGEIYNYLEIRRDLKALGHVFNSESDTEVLLRAYLQWGTELHSRLNGMWAFLIWDPRTQCVFISRDRFGVKPLYFTQTAGCVALASEPKALLRLYPNLRTVNKRALYRFIAYGELYAENSSFFAGINLVPPGSFAVISIENPRVDTHRYWELLPGAFAQPAKIDALEEFSTLFASAVDLRLRSDVAVGLSLSGGIDSSCILGALAQNGQGTISCLTAVYGSHDQGEMSWATIAAAAAGAPLLPIDAQHDDWLESMQKISWHMDAPGYSPAVFPAWKIMAAARAQNIPVMLEGQGADEAFAGYPQYAAILLLSMLRNRRAKTFLRQYSQLLETFPGKILALWLLRESMPKLFRLYQNTLGGRHLLRHESFDRESVGIRSAQVYDPIAAGSPMTQRLKYDFTKAILPGLLHYGDAISMAHSIETRLPFLDYRLVEWIFSASDSLKIDDGATKIILRRYLNRVGLSAIANRRDKRGYPTPVNQWLTANNGSLAQELLLSSNSQILEFCDSHAISRLIARQSQRPALSNDSLYKLVSTEFWLRNCIHAH